MSHQRVGQIKRRNIKEKRCDEEWLLEMEVDFFQPLLYIKAGTGFSDPGEVTVTDDFGFGIVEAEALQKF